MDNKLTKWLHNNYNKIINSIAFYPAIIAIGFLILSILMQKLDFSEAGKHIKASASWISLRDTNTARSIVSTIAGGIISEVQEKVEAIEGVEKSLVELTFVPAWDRSMMSDVARLELGFM